MTTRKYSSISQETTLTAALSSGATTMTVNSASALMSSIAPANTTPLETFTVVIDPDTALEEIVDVVYPSTGSNNTLTIQRNIDSSVAIAHSAGAKVRHMAIGRDFREANTHVEQTTGTVHGVVLNTLVKTSDTGTVTSTMIADGTILNADINASAAIDKTKISGTAVTVADTGTVTNTMLAGSIAPTKVTGTAVTQADTGTVSSAMIANSTIVNADISATAAIDLTKLATDPLARANHTGTQTASTISNFDTQVRSSRLDQMAAPTASVSLNTQKITNLATPTLSADAATKNYVDSSISALIAGAPSTLDTLAEIANALANTANFSDTVVLKSGSTMTGNLAMGTNKVTGLGTPSLGTDAATKDYVDAVAGSASAAAASAAAAAASYDSFDDRYLGAKATAPSLDNDGNALLTGALYWSTSINAMQVYNGSTWGSISSSVSASRWRKTAVGGETTLTGTDDLSVSLLYTVGWEQVYLNGVLLVRGVDYVATTGTSITGLSPALSVDDVAEVISFTPFTVSNALTQTIVDQKGDVLVGAANDSLGRLAVGTNGYVLTADSTQTLGVKWAASSGGAGLQDIFLLMGA